MKLTKNFYLQEFVSPKIYGIFGDRSLKFIDPRIVNIAQSIRDRLDAPIVINGRFNGKTFRYSGFRSIYAKGFSNFSQHRFGRAIDIKCYKYSPQEIYDDIMSNQSIYYEFGVRRVEDIRFTPTWNHIDIGWTNTGRIVIVRPRRTRKQLFSTRYKSFDI